MNASSFLHLHNHTEYSMLDGAAKVKPMLAEAQRLQMPRSHHPRYGASLQGAIESGMGA